MSLQKMVEKQVGDWQMRQRDRSVENKPGVISIARQVGAGGINVAKKLANKLKIN